MAKPAVCGISNKEFKDKIKLSPAGGYLFCGEEEYVKDLNIERLRKIVRDGGMEELNRTKYDYSGSQDFSELQSEISLPPVMSEYRMLEVEGIAPLELDKSEKEALIRCLDEIPEGLILVFRMTRDELILDNKTLKDSTVKALTERLTVVNCPRQSERDLLMWADRIAKKSGVEISEKILLKLFTLAQNDMFVISGELDKLINYVLGKGRHTVTGEDLELLVEGGVDYAFYLLADKVFSGDASGAVEVVASLKRQRANEIATLASITKTLANMQVLVSGVEPKDAKAITGTETWLLEKLARKTRGLKKDFFIEAERLAFECEMRMKSEGHDKYLLLETLSIRLAALAKKYRREF